MSTLSLNLPASYPWVVGVAATIPFLTFWQSMLVSGARKAAKIQYPQVYATKEEESANPSARKFNCAQRAHQNTMENVPQVYASLLIAGVQHPRVAAISGLLYVVGRIVFTVGYNSGEPKGRVPGSLISYLGMVSLFFTSAYTTFGLLQKTGYHF
ncbi:membrane-associated proteins in eicosanoid and glutathione metabolism [Meira miltonrushii]|uniref:Membrane-associated proteins in eicosanoid and glutathione metabolism n=1 Tax=Meira miltonrushii TaxID=1280837 RepID=A0A316VKR0_9BASI|nr:membrane-associated proteins in eicosanoid and glutathione metabolism [Meira miltonrushii]PWN37648.1 membrane-associated proteins in eicosanoid and glutathione metabolism [Meira miltonrushii]